MARRFVATGAVLAATAAVVGLAPAATAAPLNRAPAASTVRRTAVESAFVRNRLHGDTVRTMTTVSSGGVTISVPSSVTTFNKRRVTVRPAVSVRRGTTKSVTSVRLSVYSGRRRVAHSTSAHLRIGRYTERVTVRYHSYRYLTRYRKVTTRTLHPGGYPTNTVCTVGSVSSSMNDGVDDTIGTATCRSASYPGQAKSVTGPALSDVPQGDDTHAYAVGQSVSTAQVYFGDYYTSSTKNVAYRVKQWTGYHSFTTGKHRLTIRDGGYDKFFSGRNTDGGAHYFRTSAASDWGYYISCGDYGFFGVNWSSARGAGQFGPGDAPYGASERFYTAKWHGRVKLQVYSANCMWTVGIFSKKPIH